MSLYIMLVIIAYIWPCIYVSDYCINIWPNIMSVVNYNIGGVWSLCLCEGVALYDIQILLCVAS